MQAIVLSRRDFREVDQLISVYTREQGKRELLARGIKKITSKNAAHLEPFSLVQIEVAAGRELDHITTAQAMESFPAIRAAFMSSVMATTIVELVNDLTNNNQAETGLFDLLCNSLQTLEKQTVIPPWFVDAFALRCMVKLGFSPTLDRCVVCATKEADAWSLAVALGGKLCSSCRQNKYRDEVVYLDCSGVALTALESLLIGSVTVDIDHKSGSQLHEFVYQFLLFHSEKRVSDWVVAVSL